MEKKLVHGSCLDLEVDIVVNAANRYLVSGGGICGAIFNQAGYEELNNACKQIKTPLNDGDAIITSAFNIKNAKYIIHAVGPNFEQTPNAFDKLFNSYYNSFRILKENNLHSISFPLISAGIFGGNLENPVKESTKQFINAYNKFINDFPEYELQAYLCAFTRKEYEEARMWFYSMNLEEFNQKWGKFEDYKKENIKYKGYDVYSPEPSEGDTGLPYFCLTDNNGNYYITRDIQTFEILDLLEKQDENEE